MGPPDLINGERLYFKINLRVAAFSAESHAPYDTQPNETEIKECSSLILDFGSFPSALFRLRPKLIPGTV